MIKILTDSTANVPKSIIDQYGIEVIPTYVHFGATTYLDGVDLTAAEFYEKLVAATELPTTSQISVADFEKVYRKMHEANPDATILSIHVSGALSGTIESARIAAANLPDTKIMIFDTHSLALGHGLIVNEAARLAHEGKPVEDIIKRLEAMRDTTQLYWTMDTLDYLAKSGRIGRGARFLGTMLNMKPILTLKDGAIEAHERQRSRQRALTSVRELVSKSVQGKADAGIGADVHIGVFHAACEEDAKKLADELRAELNPAVLLVGDLGPSVGVYGGPGTLGVAWSTPASS
jgi:DegV family protein with EDD domain